MNQEDVRGFVLPEKERSGRAGRVPDYGQVECRQVFRGGLQREDDGSGIGMALRSCHGEECKVKGNQPAIGRDTRFGTLHSIRTCLPSRRKYQPRR